jgi:hypothetical protein
MNYVYTKKWQAGKQKWQNGTMNSAKQGRGDTEGVPINL